MQAIVDRLREVVARDGLLDARDGVLALLSGGRDSVCLLDLAVGLRGAGAVRALHVDYGLRDASSDDARHCEALCAELGVPLELRRPRRPEDAPGNLQAWARDERYGAAAELVAQRDAVVAAGHTATDQAETILYRLAASPGRRALLGMAARDGRLVRPLLGFTRAETTAYCEARGLSWRDDESNEHGDYARTRARARLVPALRELHPAAEANVIRTADLLREEAAVLDELVDAVLGGGASVEVQELRELPAALRRLVVRRLAEQASGELAPRAAARVDDVLALGRDGALDLGDGARARVADGVLRFERTPPLPAAPPTRA